MANFETAYQETMKSEGGYSNNHSDKGGETWRGIARNMWPSWDGWKLVDEIALNCGGSPAIFLKALAMDEELDAKVKSFYKVIFWDKLKLSLLPDQVADEIFDTAVNQGPGSAVRYFQQALNMLNYNQAHYPDIEVDGAMGSNTLFAWAGYMATATKVPGRNAELNIKVILKAMNGLQYERYKEIVNRETAQEVFFYGWIQRT
jgi:lysozyme family protein